ncbi:hypothetical protein C0J52_14467, partial [Blattella germanica]
RASNIFGTDRLHTYRTHSKPLFKKLNIILTVTSLYIIDCLMYVKKNIDIFETNSDSHSCSTRHRNTLKLIFL